MALWLGQAKTEHRSLHALIQSYKDEPDNTWPLTVLSRQVEKAARTRLKGQADGVAGSKRERQDLIERGEFDADRDIATLFYLFVGVNADFLSEKRALCLLVLLLPCPAQERILVARAGMTRSRKASAHPTGARSSQADPKRTRNKTVTILANCCNS